MPVEPVTYLGLTVASIGFVLAQASLAVVGIRSLPNSPSECVEFEGLSWSEGEYVYKFGSRFCIVLIVELSA
jgi:hypothetical protein